jgi:hypothetical protein
MASREHHVGNDELSRGVNTVFGPEFRLASRSSSSENPVKRDVNGLILPRKSSDYLNLRPKVFCPGLHLAS